MKDDTHLLEHCGQSAGSGQEWFCSSGIHESPAYWSTTALFLITDRDTETDLTLCSSLYSEEGCHSEVRKLNTQHCFLLIVCKRKYSHTFRFDTLYCVLEILTQFLKTWHRHYGVLCGGCLIINDQLVPEWWEEMKDGKELPFSWKTLSYGIAANLLDTNCRWTNDPMHISQATQNLLKSKQWSVPQGCGQSNRTCSSLSELKLKHLESSQASMTAAVKGLQNIWLEETVSGGNICRFQIIWIRFAYIRYIISTSVYYRRTAVMYT